VTAVTPQ